MALVSGTRLGPYEIQSSLGAGGMGGVYGARDTRLNRIVAIKILPPDLSRNPEAGERFDREARTISSLNHLGGGQYPRWRGGRQGIVLSRAERHVLMAVDVDLNGSAPRIGIPQKLLDVHLVYSPSSPESSAYDVALDGQRFLVDSMDHVPLPQPINLVLNWDTQLKK